jgi:conjugative relaxase-like TrwC/TraI family protein
LTGEVTPQAFHALCDNLNPQTKSQLTARDKENRRVGYDFNFNCPKGVSIAYELSQDTALLKAFRDSVGETMKELEKEMKARVRVNHQNSDRVTGNIVYGEFIHKTSRPENGVPDPHLHAHCFVFNATHDSIENRWKAGQFGDIKRDAPYYEAAFHARFSWKLRELGYEIEKQGKFWDIAGISKKTRDKFSNRTKRIEELALEKGITSAHEKDKLGALTRERKNLKLSSPELLKKWSERLTDLEKKGLGNLKNNSGLTQKVNQRFTEEKAMNYAVSDLFERESVCSEKLLQASALRYGVGHVTVEGVKRQVFQEGILRSEDAQGRVNVTHQKVLCEEQQMIAFTRDGVGKCSALNLSWVVQDEKITNSPEQAHALRHICHSLDQVIALTGQAGTGKTTLMTESVAAIKKGGHEVFVFAPSSSASRGVLRGEGFKHAQTVEHLLTNADTQAKLPGQVIWIDEAGLLGSPSMNRVFQLAKEKNCRVILSGDSGQHHAVQRGDALRILEKHAGLKSVQLTEIFRQRGNEKYKQAITQVRNQDFRGAFETLGKMGAVQEIADETKRVEKLSKTYVDAARTYSSVLVVSPTHAEAEAVTEAIRNSLRQENKLAKTDQNFTRLQNVNWKVAQKLDPRNYESGMVVKFHQNKPGIKRGEKWEVKDVDRVSGNITIHNGRVDKVLPIEEQHHFQVYQKKTISLTVGDQVRVTENSYSLEKGRLNNGEIRQVTDIKESGEIVLDGKYTLPRDSGCLTHGYCTTSHSSQGKTVDCVIIAESEESLPAASLEQFYVSLSRGRHSVVVFTHNKEELMNAVQRLDHRLSAHDIGAAKMLPAKKKEIEKQAVSPLSLRVLEIPSRSGKSRGVELER